MRFLVDGCYLLAAGLLTPVMLYRAWTTGKYRSDWNQRRGFLPDLPVSNRRIWVHAVSVGEVNAVRGLVEAWRRQSPDVEFVISTTTDTGQARARQIFPDLRIVRYPLDFSWFVNRALDRIKPTMVVLVELEVWYQFATLAAGRGVPIAVVNGRLSERSVRRFGLIGSIARRMFESLAWVGAQDADYADRFRRMGVPADRVSITSSVKWDGADVSDSIVGADSLARDMGLDPTQPIWVCGSTGPGEEQVILDAYRKLAEKHEQLQLVMVPRKPERFDEVADLIARTGFTCIRRSRCTDGGRMNEPQADTVKPQSAERAGSRAVYLGDTMGELRKFYSLAAVTFVGRSLSAMGGSDTMEVAALAKPIVVGPHNENFADTTIQLQRGRAIRILKANVNDARAADELAAEMGELLGDPAEAVAMGHRGREVVLANRGATQRTLDKLMEMLNRAQHRNT